MTTKKQTVEELTARALAANAAGKRRDARVRWRALGRRDGLAGMALERYVERKSRRSQP